MKYLENKKKQLTLAKRLNLWNIQFTLLPVNLFGSVYYVWKCGQWFTKYLGNEKGNLHCQSDQTYERFHEICYMLICLIQFSMFESGNTDSRKFSRMNQAIYDAKVIKLMKHFIKTVNFNLFYSV